MKRIRTLLAAWIAATAVLLALSGAASAADSINSYPMSFYSSGTGQWDGYRYGQNGGGSFGINDPAYSTGSDGFGEAGVTLAIYGTDGTNNTAATYGFHGAYPLLPGSAPFKTTVGSETHLQSEYRAGNYDANGICLGDPCLRITEIAAYDPASDDSIYFTYYVTNDGTVPVKYRLSLSADPDIYYSGDGRGYIDGSNPRFLGVDNASRGDYFEFQEVGASPWSRYQESAPFKIWQTLRKPLNADYSVSDGLANSVSSQNSDKAVAIQWDNHVASGLAANTQDTYQVYARWGDYDAVTLSDPGNVVTGTNAPATVTATVTDRHGDPIALQNTDVHYQVDYGPDENTGRGYQTKAPQSVGGNTANMTINWTGDGTAAAADDEVKTWVDLNHDGIQDADEPIDYQTINWFDALRAYPDSSSGRINYSSIDINVVSSDPNTGARVYRPFKWKVEGANPQTDFAGDPTNGFKDCDATCAQNGIPLLNDNTGYDTVTVWSDTNGDADFADFGEKRTFKVRWYSDLSISPSASTYSTTYGTINAYLYLHTPAFDDWANQDVDYVVLGPNGQTAGSCASPAVNATDGNTACKVTTDAYGDANIKIATASAGDVKLIAWLEEDNVDGSGPTAGDRTIATGSYTVYVSQDQRLTTDAGTYGTLNATQGSPVNLGVHSVTALGAPDTTHKLRYSIEDGSLDSTDYREKELSPDGSGNFTLPTLTGGGMLGSDDIDMYVDVNGNNQQDSNEPYEYVTIRWNKRAQISTSGSDTYAFQGSSAYVYARLQHADGSAFTGTFHWSVDGGPQQSGTATTSASTNAYFTVPPQSLGNHTITVSFDDGGTQSDSVVIAWKPRYTLTLTPDKTDLSTGAKVTVAIAVTDNATGLAAPAGMQIHYSIQGANDDSYTEAVPLDSQGKASVSWVGKLAGGDTIYAYPDLDQNGGMNGTESSMQKTKTVTFHNRVDITGSFGGKYEGNSQSVTVKFRDDAYQPLVNKTLAWQVTGANPKVGAVTTDANGNATFNWTGSEPGVDTVVVWQDSDADGSVDPSEQASATKTVNWSKRIYAAATTCCTKPSGSAYTINVTLQNLDGSNQSGAVLHWIGTGPNNTSGDTTATTASGTTSFQINSQNGGTEQIVVFLDKNANGVRDAGEPQDTETVYWSSTVTICSCTSTKPEGNSQVITAVNNSGGGTLRYQVFGTHPAGPGLYNSGVTLNGTSKGTDSVVIWADNGDGVRGAGEPASWFTMYWTPRLQLSGADGVRVAGGNATVVVQRLTAGGLVDTTPGVSINYTVTGPNGPKNGTVQTNSLGKAAVTYTSDIQGTDTVAVTDTVTGFSNSKSVYWSAPPVSLSLTHNSTASALQGNTHTVTAKILGVSIPPAGYPVHFAVSGANTASGTVQSDASGTAQFTWKGDQDGTDTVAAYGDISGATGQDGYDPSSSTSMTWQPAVQLSSTTSDQAIGEPHTETVHFVDISGNPLANADVWYQVTGANPSGAIANAREFTSSTGSRIQARTDGSGNVGITWTGTNSGTDTLNAWGDSNGNFTLDPATDAHATKTVTWRAASISSTPPSGGSSGPVAYPAGVTPGSAQDIDGLATPPPPVVAKSVNVAPVKGRVFVKLPGKAKFIELVDAEQIPVGSIVDVRKGTVALTSAQNLTGGVATAEFYAGQFQIAQKKAAKPVTDLVLYGGSFAACGKAARKGSATGAQKKKIRELWGNGKGSFRTKGKYAAAAIRGTKWDVVDYCDGTLVKVAQGVVTVEPNKGKSQALKAPKSLFVPTAGLAKKK